MKPDTTLLKPEDCQSLDAVHSVTRALNQMDKPGWQLRLHIKCSAYFLMLQVSHKTLCPGVQTCTQHMFFHKCSWHTSLAIFWTSNEERLSQRRCYSKVMMVELCAQQNIIKQHNGNMKSECACTWRYIWVGLISTPVKETFTGCIMYVRIKWSRCADQKVCRLCLNECILVTFLIVAMWKVCSYFCRRILWWVSNLNMVCIRHPSREGIGLPGSTCVELCTFDGSTLLSPGQFIPQGWSSQVRRDHPDAQFGCSCTQYMWAEIILQLHTSGKSFD